VHFDATQQLARQFDGNPHRSPLIVLDLIASAPMGT